MKLLSIESFTNEFVGFVRVTAEDGLQGWGQVSTYHSDITCQILHRQVAPWVLGQDTSDLDDLLDVVTEREHKFPLFGICVVSVRVNQWPNCWVAPPDLFVPMLHQ